MENKISDKDLAMAYEEFMGTHQGKLCFEVGVQFTTAIEFARFYIKKRNLKPQ